MQPGTVFFTGLLIILFFILYFLIGAITVGFRAISTNRKLKIKPFLFFYSLISFLFSYVAVTNSVSLTANLSNTNTHDGFWGFVISAIILVIFGSINALISFFAFFVLQIVSSILLYRVFSRSKDKLGEKNKEKDKVIEGEIIE